MPRGTMVSFAFAALAVGEACDASPPKATERPAPADSATVMPSERVIALGALEQPTDVVVFLHGVGASAESFRSLAEAVAPALPRALMLVPDGLHRFDHAKTGRQWFSMNGITDTNRPELVRVAAAEVSAWIDRELDRRGVARDRVALVGFSQGAIVASWLAVHRSPAPEAVVLVSGRVSDDVVPVGGSVATPVLVLHGELDPIIPVSLVDPGVRQLEGWGARVTKHVYADLAHTIDPREVAEARAFLAGALPR